MRSPPAATPTASCARPSASAWASIALADPAAAERARGRFAGPRARGPRGRRRSWPPRAGRTSSLNAVVGAAGLEATLAALAAGIDVALANKESLVAGGPLVRAALAASTARLLPVDSEHSALHQLLEGEEPDAVEALIVTASGGPFRGGLARRARRRRRPQQALRHPTWAMGARITIDSATLMNKGLEVIEAHWLFDVPFERIEVVVHPQSIVHALVRLRDGALLAHLGLPDMRVPIAYALAHPRRAAVAAPRLDLTQAFSLTFEPADTETFRCLALARAAGIAGGLAPCALNAADEEAVAAFLAGRCRFTDIPALVERALETCSGDALSALEQVRESDAAARACVRAGARGRGARLSALIAIGGLLALVFIHELGHFVAAKSVGMRVTKFYVGFPPAVIKRTIGATEYGIGLIPLGGFVRIVGMGRPRGKDLRACSEAAEKAAERRPHDEPDLPHARAAARRARARQRRSRARAPRRWRCSRLALEQDEELDRRGARGVVPQGAHARHRGRRSARLLAPAHVAPDHGDRGRPRRQRARGVPHPHHLLRRSACRSTCRRRPCRRCRSTRPPSTWASSPATSWWASRGAP